jgi:hypothetical protein
VRRIARYRVAWSRVIDLTAQRIQLDVRVEATPQIDWERWLRRHVVENVPGERQ